ncbi:MAG: MFS transporter [Leptospirales bacterium]|nr:MFS transporter [Leptospirales bacterium]
MHAMAMFLYFAGLASQLASLSPHALACYGEQGSQVLAAAQIGTPLGAFFFGWLSDRLRRVRSLALGCLCLAAPLQALAFSGSASLGAAMLWTFLLRAILAGAFQLISIGALEAAGNESFGRIRSSGTIGFLFAQTLLWLLSGPFEAWLHWQSPAQFGRSGALFYIFALAPASQLAARRLGNETYYFREALRRLTDGPILYFTALAFLFFSAYQATDNYVSRYYELRHGMDAVFLSWIVAVGPEIVLLLYISRLEQNFGLRALFLMAALCGMLRFLLLAANTGQDSAPIYAAAQLLHSFHFACHYMAAIYFLRRHVPGHLYGSVAGLYGLLAQSLGGISGNLAYGQLLYSAPFVGDGNYGGFSALFLLAAASNLLLLPAYFWLQTGDGKVQDPHKN